MRAIEQYYSVAHVALLLAMSERWVTQKIAEGAFGDPAAADGPVQLGTAPGKGDWRIPASQVNGYIERCRPAVAAEEPVTARTAGELRRKVVARRSTAMAGQGAD